MIVREGAVAFKCPNCDHEEETEQTPPWFPEQAEGPPIEPPGLQDNDNIRPRGSVSADVECSECGGTAHFRNIVRDL